MTEDERTALLLASEVVAPADKVRILKAQRTCVMREGATLLFLALPVWLLVRARRRRSLTTAQALCWALGLGGASIGADVYLWREYQRVLSEVTARYPDDGDY